MPTIQQLNAMCEILDWKPFKSLIGDDAKLEVMRLTIVAIQAKALADISYNLGMMGVNIKSITLGK